MDIIHIMSQGQKGIMGIALVTDAQDYSIITDGDLRRGMEKYKENIFDKKAIDFMSSKPVSVAVGTRVIDALQLMESKKITTLLVTENNNVVGVFKK